MYDLFNAAASQRILYLVDKYISVEARSKGEELMKKYDVYHPILRRRLEKDTCDQVNYVSSGLWCLTLKKTPDSLNRFRGYKKNVRCLMEDV